MALTKIWNDNKYDYSEKFKGTQIVIPAGGFVEMDFDDAIEFKGQFTSPVLGADDAPDPKHFKMLRVDWPKSHADTTKGLVCHADGTSAATPAELAAMLMKFAPMLARDELAEREATEKAAAQRVEAADQIALLTMQIDELRALITAEKRGPGRPPKDRAEGAA